MKQHAFIFQVHKQPELFSRIVRRLDSGNHHFFVNVDAKVKNPNDFESSVKDVANVHFMSPRWNVHHGGRSQYLCTLDLLRMVKRMLPDYAFVHSLSGQDYPLRSNAEFDSFFEKTDKGFMAIEDDEYNAECMSGKYPMRVNLWHFNNPHTFIARVYNHSVLRQIISRLVQRPDVQGLRGVELVYLDSGNSGLRVGIHRKSSGILSPFQPYVLCRRTYFCNNSSSCG